MERKQFIRNRDYKDKPLLIKFLQEEQVNGISEKRYATEASVLRVINDYKPLDSEWTKDDITSCLLKLQEDDYKASSLDTYKIIMRKFFRWTGKPDIVLHLKIKTHKNSLRREDLLTVEDINKMIDAAGDSPMYQALVSLLFESGARINEVLALKRKDIQETDRGMLINIPTTKTGNDYRRGVYPFSAQYIRNHITYSAIASDDKLFKPCHRTIWEMLRKFAKKAEVKKPVNPHAFRHAAATDALLRGYKESIIKKKFGWTTDSRMLGRYIKVVDEDVINETLEKAGMDVPKQPIAKLKQAESLKIANASLQLSKLSEENESLKSEVETMRKDMEKIQKFIEMGGLELLKKNAD